MRAWFPLLCRVTVTLSDGRPRRKSISAALTGAGASCWTQWPAPSTSTSPRWSVSHAVHGLGRAHNSTGSSVPPMNSDGTSTLAPASCGGQLPVAVEVAVPVDAAGEAGAGELGDVVVELGLASASRAGRRARAAVDEAPSVVGEHRPGRSAAGSVRVAPAQHAAHRGGGSAPSSASATPGLLEVEDVEEGVAEHLAHRAAVGGSGARGRNGTLMPDHAGDPLGRCSSASGHTTMEPQSWPTNTAGPRRGRRGGRAGRR